MTSPTDDQRQTVWDRLANLRTVMMQIDDRLVPMSPKADAASGTLWFITASDTPMARAAANGTACRLVVCNDSESLYLDMTGHLALSDDAAQLDEVWGPIAGAWFEDGPNDPDVRLMRYTPKKAEVWLGEGGALGFAYQIAKAHLTETKPDIGDHFTMSF